MIPLMPKELCNQSITLRLLDGHDKWQKPVFSEPVINKNHVGSKIDFEGETYTITTIVDNRNPYSNEVYSYELEVL